MNSNPIVVVTTANDNYFQGLCVTLLSSIVSTSADCALSFRVFDTGLSGENKRLLSELVHQLKPEADLEFLAMEEQLFHGLCTDYGGGYSTYARLLMGSLIPEDKAIYIDSDFLVMRDLAQVWNEDFGGKIMLATKDYDTPDGQANRLSADCPFTDAHLVEGFDYFNCGFLMIDLNAWRTQDVEKSAFEQIKGYEHRLKAWDQTILNYVLRGKIGELDPNWCWSCTMAKVPYPCNIHYISRMKPWNAWSLVPAYRLWYAFHGIFVGKRRNLEIPPGETIRGISRLIRDSLFMRFELLGTFYTKVIRSRRGERNAELYASYLKKCRETVATKDWKSKNLIRSLLEKWKGLQPTSRVSG